MSRRRATLAAAGTTCVGFLSLAAAAGVQAAGTWSAPAALTRCSGNAAPRIAFPQSNPYTRTGAGAIVWGGDPTRCGSQAASPAGLGIAALDLRDRPGVASAVRVRSAQRLSGPGGVSATCAGRVVITAALGAASGPAGVLLEGKPGASFSAPLALGGPPAPQSVTRAYRGDIAVASIDRDARGGNAVALRVQPYNADSMRSPITLARDAAGVDAIADALDFRADALVVWHRGTGVYAREWLQPGQLGPIQRLGSAGPDPQLQPLISDNGHAIAVWTDTRTNVSGASETRIYISVARQAHRFEPAQVIERFTNLAGVRPREGAIRLVRLSTETVVLAWTGMSAGHYVVRVAPVSIDAVPRGRVISRGHADALLADLAPGPHGQALALWTAAPRSGRPLDVTRARLIAAPGRIARHFRPEFRPPELVAAARADVAAVNAAYDPSSNRAVAVWRGAGSGAAVMYAVRGSDTRVAVRAPAGAAACPELVGHPFRRALEITAAALAVLAALGLTGWWVVRRSRGGR